METLNTSCPHCGEKITNGHHCFGYFRPCPYLNTDNLTCSHPDITFYDIICSKEVCPNA